MNIFEFTNLPEVEDFSELINPKAGTKFLFGKTMLAQKQNAEIGREISYYEVISVRKDGKNLEYRVVIERLERPEIRED